MRDLEKKLLTIFAITTIAYFLTRETTVELTPGVKIPNPPFQENLKSKDSFKYKDSTLTKMAKIHLKAKILSKMPYSDRNAYLAPIDLALGWGVMSDETIIKQFKISQSVRYTSWRIKDRNNYSYSDKDVASSIANMHIIPANDAVKKAVFSIRKGDIIELKGNLVYLKKENGETWNSSLVRTDTGNGACELVWLEEIKIITGEY